MAGPEIEVLALDGVTQEAARAGHHALPPGSACPNCAAILQGPWCHACGQKADDYHRSIWHLGAEAFEGLTHFDGRLWRTLGRLALNPGRLTCEFVEGRRASQLPPFRLFLIVVLILFFVGGLKIGQHDEPPAKAEPAQEETAKEKPARISLAPDQNFGVSIKRAGQAAKPLTITGAKTEAFEQAVERWGHRFALLSVVVMAPMVAVLFLGRRRRRYFFDHLIFSLHSLSFQGLLFSLTFLLRDFDAPFSGLLFLLFPVHLFFHLRGAYRLGTFSAIWRTIALLIGQIIGFVALMVGLVLVGVAAAT